MDKLFIGHKSNYIRQPKARYYERAFGCLKIIQKIAKIDKKSFDKIIFGVIS